MRSENRAAPTAIRWGRAERVRNVREEQSSPAPSKNKALLQRTQPSDGAARHARRAEAGAVSSSDRTQGCSELVDRISRVVSKKRAQDERGNEIQPFRSIKLQSRRGGIATDLK